MKELFNDDNKINEKSLIGFLAFLVMVGFALADVFTGYYGKDLVVNEFIFNAFLVLCLCYNSLFSCHTFHNYFCL